MSVTTIDLIRHGEPVGGRKYRGQIDDPLSEKGWQQMRTAVAGHSPWQHILTSPLSRCEAFARELAAQHKLSVSVENNLKEIGFGVWEGKTRSEIESDHPGILKKFYADPVSHRPEGAEPLAEFQQRIASVMNTITSSHQGSHVLVVCHAGVIRMTLLHFLGFPLTHVFRVQVSNASITRIEVEQHEDQIQPRLLFHDGQL